MKALSLYSGIGGLDFGFEAAGFTTAVALDNDPRACSTMRLNRAWPVLEGPVADFSNDQILEAAGLRSEEADVLIGGPPCQPFSKSGYWSSGDARRLSDPRADTLSEYLRVLAGTLSAVFLLENVPGLAYKGKSEGIRVIEDGIKSINERAGTRYTCSVRSLNAVDYGVPQLRERVFVVGFRNGHEFRFPQPTHFPADRLEVAGGGQVHRTAWDAFATLAPQSIGADLEMTGKWAGLLGSVPEGQNYLWHTERGGGQPLFGWRRRYWNFLLKLAKDRPSWTIQAQPGPSTGPFHWDSRRLSPMEAARLQTFPDGLQFDGTLRDAQRLIGNAVPSALAEVLALAIRRQLVDATDTDECLATLVPARQSDIPEAKAVEPVPPIYMTLAGNDTEHPGTGRGRGALQRDDLSA